MPVRQRKVSVPTLIKERGQSQAWPSVEQATEEVPTRDPRFLGEAKGLQNLRPEVSFSPLPWYQGQGPCFPEGPGVASSSSKM